MIAQPLPFNDLHTFTILSHLLKHKDLTPGLWDTHSFIPNTAFTLTPGTTYWLALRENASTRGRSVLNAAISATGSGSLVGYEYRAIDNVASSPWTMSFRTFGFAVNGSAAVVPEPRSISTLAIFGCFACMMRRRKKSNSFHAVG